MAFWKQLLGASGYLSVLSMPALLVIGISFGHPCLAFGVVLLIFPLVRSVFGAAALSEPVCWREDIATMLECLPLVYAISLMAAVALVLQKMAVGVVDSVPAALGLALSLWATMFFATTAAHELVHRRSAVHRRIGAALAGLGGYPMLGREHLAHHARRSKAGSVEWPDVDESVWLFAARRSRQVVRDARVSWRAPWRSAGRGSPGGINMGFAWMGSTWIAFSCAGGAAGFLIYLGVVVAVIFSMQVVTYLQHWGLGDKDGGEAASCAVAWEDDCRFQVWMTFGISLHQAHHRAPRIPYYRLAISPDSPRQPAGYVILFFVCMVPALWRRVMLPALEHWQRQPHDARSPGRRLTCFAQYGAPP